MLTQFKLESGLFKSELGLRSRVLSRSAMIDIGFLKSKKHSVLAKPVLSGISVFNKPYVYVWRRLKNQTMLYRVPIKLSMEIVKGRF